MFIAKLRSLWAIALVSVFVLAGCAVGDGSDGGSPENNHANNLSCKDQCSTAGAMRCQDSVIETCTANAEGCTVWQAGDDCAASEQICNGNQGAAECVGGPDQSCDDGTQNQDETDVDCGGSACSPCGEDKACTEPSDCMSGNCDVGGADTCVPADAATCTDGVQNQDETDIDCGGQTCSGCAIGAACTEHGDCASGACDFIDTDQCIDATPSFEVDEDFETGDFSLFPYDFASDASSDPKQWQIETDANNCHAGSFCMRTNSVHGEGETTEVTLSLSVRQDTEITFWVKTHTEPDEHYFRFYVDGQQQVELSGENAWQKVSVPVTATGPNGPDRTFTWEYRRSTFLDPNHVPWNEVWIDDIDMPAWNTEPSVPETIAPWNGKLTTDRSPTFRWHSFDPDFDTIAYEMEYDTDPNFSDPKGTGETNDVQFTPPADLDDDTVYYWRVRAKDDNNYRWSDWSPTWSVEVDSTYEYAVVWRQSTGEQFALNTLSDVQTTSSSVQPKNSELIRTKSDSDNSYIEVTFQNLPPAIPGTDGMLDIHVSGDFDRSDEYADVNVDGVDLGKVNSRVCNTSRTFQVPDINQHLGDGNLDIDLLLSNEVHVGGCSAGASTPEANVELTYSQPVTATMVTDAIDFSVFGAKSTWEKLQWTGSGDVSIQVLDASGQLVPDSIIPNNSTGLTSNTIHLWGLEPSQYPAIKLKATIENGAEIESWRVVGNDVYEWNFSRDGDQQGWQAKDHNGTPTASITGGVYRYESTAAGDDPRIEYAFPQPVDASQFTTLEVRLRTSNNYNDDEPAVFWDSNYGSFDTRRSFTKSAVFLLNFQDLSYDLSTMRSSPQEPWRGQINAIRLDPVVRFKDQAGDFSDGWFEIERIALY